MGYTAAHYAIECYTAVGYAALCCVTVRPQAHKVVFLLHFRDRAAQRELTCLKAQDEVLENYA